MRALLVLILAGCLVASGAAVAETASSKSRTQASATIANAKSSSRVQGTVPAGANRIRSTRKVRGERAPLRPSEGQLAGLTHSGDPLQLKSHVALVVDQDTDEVLFEKNIHAVLPIASITKLMTALVTVEAELPLDEELKVTPDELVRAGIRSNLRPGLAMSRGTAFHLALMSSENRAAQLLGRTYPGGLPDFVEAMNAKARMLGMNDSHFVDPTGLSPENRSSANDLVRLVKAAYEHDVIREYSVSGELALPIGPAHPELSQHQPPDRQSRVGDRLQKTGYISAAGRCLVMQAVIEGKRVVMVLLDSVGKYSRIADAQRIRDWLESNAAVTTAPSKSAGSSAASAAKPI